LIRPWRRIRMTELIEERFGWKFDKRPLYLANPGLWNVIHHRESKELFQLFKDAFGEPQDEESSARLEGIRRTLQAKIAIHLDQLSPAEQLVELYEIFIEPDLFQPTFVTHVPSVVVPLAKENKDDPFFA